MLLSSARATLDAPSARAAATATCLLSEYGLRDMACSFKAVVEDGSGAGKHSYQGVVGVGCDAARARATRWCVCRRTGTRNGNIIKDAGSHTHLTVRRRALCPME